MNQSSTQLSLPQWVLMDGENPVCNFDPLVLECQEVRTPNRELSQIRVRLSLKFADDTNEESTVNLSELDRLDWNNLNRQCIINPQNRNAKGYIATIIRTRLKNAPVRTIYDLNRTGIFQINNSVVFVAGDRVISRSPASETDSSFLANTPFRLDTVPNLSVADAFKDMRELISLSPEIGRVLVAHVISGIIWAAYKEANFTPNTILMVTGKSGMLKSSYVTHLVQLYNRSDGIGPATRFNSTKTFIEEKLYDYSECTAVIDDLHTAESKSIKRRNEDTAEEIIRRVSDNTGRGFMDGRTQVQRQFRGNVVFIGEYTVGQASTIPRFLVANLAKKPNGEIFNKYQLERPLVVSTFYSHFIQWYVNHFNQICDDIRSALTAFRKATQNSTAHGRLLDTRFHLLISYRAFLKFCKDSGCCSEQDVADEYNFLSVYLDGLLQAQQDRLEQDGNSGPIDYLSLIRNLYYNRAFRLVKSKDAFNKNIHDGLIYDNCIYLLGDCLDAKLRQFVTNYKRNDCTDFLAKAGALNCGPDKKSKQLGFKTDDKVKNLRFYAIPIRSLQ